MLKKVLIGLVVLVLGLVVVISLQPGEFRVERSAIVSAPAAQVFPLVNDFHNWDRWSPWAGRDPQQKTTYEGAPSGKGAIQKWSGNDEVGEGQMTITESRQDEYVGITLAFLRPFESTSQVAFTFAPAGASTTRVTWAMHGESNFISKAFGLVMDMDQMLGKDFDAGLAAMNKAMVEDGEKEVVQPSAEAPTEPTEPSEGDEP